MSIGSSQEASNLPARVSPAVTTGDGACPSDKVLDAQLQTTKDAIEDLLHNYVTQPNCACGGAG